MLPKKRALYPMLITLCLASAPALAAPVANSPATTPTAVPAPNSPQAIAELHTLLREAYQQGEAAASPQATVTAAPQRPVLAAWVEVLRNAIETFSSACFIAAWGFALGMVMIGISALILAIRRTRKST